MCVQDVHTGCEAHLLSLFNGYRISCPGLKAAGGGGGVGRCELITPPHLLLRLGLNGAVSHPPKVHHGVDNENCICMHGYIYTFNFSDLVRCAYMFSSE